MKIYVARHGTTPMNKLQVVNAEIDEPLAEEGVLQATIAAASLPNSILRIYTSPLIRAVQTADILKSIRNIPTSIKHELTEIKMGELSGKSWGDMPNGLELKKLHRTVRFNYVAHGGESLETVTKRLLEFFHSVNNKFDDGQVLIITHGGIIRVLKAMETNEVVYETEKNMNLQEFDLDKIIANAAN